MKKAVCDMDIINSLKIGQNISVQINDNGINLKNGGYVADENGNRFKILSVAMINNHKRLIDSNAGGVGFGVGFGVSSDIKIISF